MKLQTTFLVLTSLLSGLLTHAIPTNTTNPTPNNTIPDPNPLPGLSITDLSTSTYLENTSSPSDILTFKHRRPPPKDPNAKRKIYITKENPFAMRNRNTASVGKPEWMRRCRRVLEDPSRKRKHEKKCCRKIWTLGEYAISKCAGYNDTMSAMGAMGVVEGVELEDVEVEGMEMGGDVEVVDDGLVERDGFWDVIRALSGGTKKVEVKKGGKKKVKKGSCVSNWAMRSWELIRDPNEIICGKRG